MDKALSMGKSSATGSFHLLIGVIGSTVIMAVGTIVLAMLLSDAELGLYGVALIPSTIINFFRDWGVNSAMTQQIASLRAANRECEIHDVIVSGVVFEMLSGAVMSLACFALAWPLAVVLQRPAASAFISILSVSIFSGAVLAASAAVFVGYEKMMLNSLTQIFQAIIKTAVGPLLVILGFSVLGAVVAVSVSFAAAGALGIAIVFLVLFKPLRKMKTGKCDICGKLKPMLKYGIPLTVSNIVVGVTPQVFAFMMALYAGDSMMGNYYSANYFSVLLTFFSIPITTALFPAFAKLNPKEEPGLLLTVFASSVKYTSVLIVPATMIVISLANPIVYTLFGAKFPYAPLFLAVSSVINLLSVVGNISLGTFLTGVGETNQLMKMSLLSLAVGMPVSLLLVSSMGTVGGPIYAVIGGILGTLISNIPGLVWGLHWVWKRYSVKVDFQSSTKILASSFFAAFVTAVFLFFFNTAAWLRLISGTVLFMVVYLVSAPLIGAVNQGDVSNFRTMFSGLGPVAKVLELPLSLVEKTLKMRSRKS